MRFSIFINWFNIFSQVVRPSDDLDKVSDSSSSSDDDIILLEDNGEEVKVKSYNKRDEDEPIE